MQYTHGGDIYTYGEMIDFSVNINPLGPSKKVIEAAKERFCSQRHIRTVNVGN